MKTKKEKLHGRGWKSRFVRLSSILMLCFNVLSAPLSAIGIATIAVTTVTLVVSCDKEEQKQEQLNPQQKHNVELVYQDIAQDLHMDTIYKYNSDPTVDTIFMTPYNSSMFSTASTTGLKNVANKLRERHNVNPNKVFGKGDLELKGASIQSNPEIYRFFADTLRYHVIVNNNSK